MKRWLVVACAAWLSSGMVLAEGTRKEPSEKQKAQQERMKRCNKEAGEKQLKGEERKKFMSGCLKAGSSPSP